MRFFQLSNFYAMKNRQEGSKAERTIAGNGKSIFKRAAAKELTQQTGWWQGTGGHRMDIAEELPQAICLGILVAVLRDKLQDGLCLLLDDGKFEEHGGVEHHISVLLVREYPLVLTLADTRPAVDGVTCAGCGTYSRGLYGEGDGYR